MLEVCIDAGDGMAGLGEVAVWAFDVAVWGECAQAASDDDALERFARRTGRTDLVVRERITGPDQVFARDRSPATDEQVAATLRRLAAQRAVTLDLVRLADEAGALDAQDDAVVQPSWMPWRTPRGIAEHLIDDARGGYLKRLALPLLSRRGDLLEDLVASGEHLQHVIRDIPRARVTTHDGEVWTSVKVLRRQAWHEGVEQVFLRRRLRAAGVL